MSPGHGCGLPGAVRTVLLDANVKAGLAASASLPSKQAKSVSFVSFTHRNGAIGAWGGGRPPKDAEARRTPGRRPLDCRFFTGQGRHSDTGVLYARQAGEMIH